MVLFRWLMLRRLTREPGRTLLTVLGVALGVAVFVAIRLASGSALAGFSDTVDAVAGRANLQVQSRSDGFDERLYPRIRQMPGVLAAAPVVQVSALARAGGASRAAVAAAAAADGADGAAGGGYHETLLILGLDPLVEAPFVRLDRDDARAASDPGAVKGAMQLLAQPRTIAITRTLANRMRLGAGDTLSVLASGLPVPLAVVQVLEAQDLQQAMGGSIAVVDLATAQEVFQKAGRLDRVDLRVDPKRRDSVRAALQAMLPGDVAVDLPQGRTKQVENMVRAFSLNLTALSFIAVFVATFLVFNTLAMAVVRQRRDIGVLRALGLTRSQVARLWLGEALAIGVAGSALGLLLGWVLAQGALGAVGRTLHDLYLIEHTDHLRLDAATLMGGAAIGILASLVSALLPALEAAHTPPGATLRQGALIEAQPLPIARMGFTGIGALVLAALLAWWTTSTRQALGGFACAFFVLAGFSLLAPFATLAAERVTRPLARAMGIEVTLGARALRETVARASTVVAALMVAVGMLVALTVMVGSFRRTVDTWITQSLRGDIYIEPAGHRASAGATALPPELIAAATKLPGVAAVDTYRGTPIRYEDALAFVVGVDFTVQRDRGHLAFLDGADGAAVLSRAIRDGGVIVTESFAHRHRVKPGDQIELPAAIGPTKVRVEGVFYDYSTDAGAVLMDARTFARLWKDDRVESLALYLRPGASVDSVRSAFLALCGPERLMNATPNKALRQRVLTVFDQTFQITWALQGIAVMVAVLGVISTLTALVLQRGREIGVLRGSGATRGQIRRMVLAESGLLGLTGAALGCVAGLVLSLVLVQVINKQFFGWTVRFTLDPWIFLQATALMIVTSLLAGLAPANLAATKVAAQAMRAE